MNKKLQKLYYDPSLPFSLYSVNTLVNSLKSKNKKIPRAQVLEWLESQDAYTLHKPRRLKFPRRNYNISNIDDLWEADLIDFRSIKSYNDGYSYILVVIDVLSKYAWAEILRNKSCTSVKDAFEKILNKSNNRVPIILQTDKGKEFMGSEFQNLLKKKI